MEDRPTGHGEDLWDDPWSRAGSPREGRERARQDREPHPRAAASRRGAELGGRDDHLTFEVPGKYSAASGPATGGPSAPSRTKRSAAPPTLKRSKTVVGRRRRIGPALVAVLVALLVVAIMILAICQAIASIRSNRVAFISARTLPATQDGVNGSCGVTAVKRRRPSTPPCLHASETKYSWKAR